MAKNQQKVLLPSHVKPIHYKIYLEPDLEAFVFKGEEEIEFVSDRKIVDLTLHSAEIEVTGAEIIGGKVSVSKISYNDRAETVTFKFKNPLPTGKSKIKISFAGILNDKMRGFYRSRYKHDGQEYHMGVTQFESTDARRAFPCFDEPSQKATFDLSLKVPSDRTVISNTLEKEVIEHEGGFKIVQFEKSPLMSSYLLAFIVGHFEHIEETTPEGVRVRVYVTPGKKKQAKFALKTASRIMSFYHNYFGISYPLPTMDLIAIPDFANGAMENWGAVTYRETALLVDEEHTSLHSKQWVALIIAHELAHQWFGNLVTMKWWTHLWLNEGFASFMEYIAIDKLFPEWHVWTQFVYTEQAKALSLDGMSNTHPIEIPVHHPGEISEIFDAVSYSKGASVIRMIEAYIGEKDFQKGLQLYLKTHKFSNAETEDLWRALEKVSKKPVGRIMKNWTSKGGYPLVSLKRTSKGLEFSQKRYFSTKSLKKDSTVWSIPMSVLDDNKTVFTLLIDKRRSALNDFSKSSWIKLNVNDTSFVRIKYPEKELVALMDPIKKQIISEEGRFAIVRDAFSLAESEDSSLVDALEILKAFENEESYIVWSEIILHLLELKSLLSGTALEDKFKDFAGNIVKNIADKSGWSKKKNESHEQTLLRSSAKFAHGTFGDKDTLDHAKKLFSFYEKGGRLPSDFRGAVFSLVAENGGAKEFKKFEKIYMNSELEEEKDRALRALCSFKDHQLLLKTLELSFSSKVRAQDAFKAVYIMSTNPFGIDIAWDYVKGHWGEIKEKFAGGHLFSRFISPFSKFKSKEKADEVEEFFKKNKAEGIGRTVAQTVEKIRANDSLILREYENLANFLKH